MPGTIVNLARELSMANGAILSRLDPDAMLVHTVAVSPGRSALPHGATAAWPGEMRVDANPYLRRVYLEGQHVSAPVRAVLDGVTPRRLAAPAPLKGQYVTMLPLQTGRRIAGSLSFVSAHRPKIPRFRVYAQLARFASFVGEVSQAAGECLGAEERIRKEAAALLHGTHAALIALRQQLGESRTALAGDPARAAAILDGVREELEQIGERDIGRTSRLLYPLTLRMSLTPALEALTERFRPRVKTALRIDAAVAEMDDPFGNRLPETLRLTVYRTVEGLLEFAADLEPPPQLEIRLSRAAGPALVLTLNDAPGVSGRGAAKKRRAEAAHRWADLGSLLFRLHNSGAALTIATARGGLTTLSASFPLRVPEEAGRHVTPRNPA